MGIKVGPTTKAPELVTLIQTLNPANVAGKPIDSSTQAHMFSKPKRRFLSTRRVVDRRFPTACVSYEKMEFPPKHR